MGVTLGMVGLGEGLRTKLINIPKNNSIARLNNASRMITRGERQGERVAICKGYSISAKNSERTLSTRTGSKSNNGGLTLHAGKLCSRDKISLINGGMGG